jgi:hypothetical protein
MTGVGQKRKGSQRAYSVRITPKSRHRRCALALPICADIVAKVAAALLWNSNLKQSNRDVRTFESMLRLRVKT